MAPPTDPDKTAEPTDDPDLPSEPPAVTRRPVENTSTDKRRSGRAELYRRMKRVDPGLARRYRQLSGQ